MTGRLEIPVKDGESIYLHPHGPQIYYVDPDSGFGPVCFHLTTGPLPDNQTVQFVMDDRTRALCRALLHVALDRLDTHNPHD